MDNFLDSIGRGIGLSPSDVRVMLIGALGVQQLSPAQKDAVVASIQEVISLKLRAKVIERLGLEGVEKMLVLEKETDEQVLSEKLLVLIPELGDLTTGTIGEVIAEYRTKVSTAAASSR